MRNVQDIYPLSPMQEGMLFHALYAPESGAYAIHISSKIEGTLDVPVFKRCWQLILDRHPILRSALLWERGEKHLQVVKINLSLPWEELDWRDRSEEGQEQQLQQYLSDQHRRGFDLSQAPLMRMALMRLADTRYQFVWNYSHTLLDGWSVNIIFSELFHYYRAYTTEKTADLPRPRPYREFIAWLQAQDKQKAEKFWRKALEGFLHPTPLGIHEKMADPIQHGSEYQETASGLGREATLKLHAIARQHRFTLTTFVQGTWGWLLSHYSGMTEVVFGVTVTGRPVSLKGVNEIVGLLVNSLPSRINVQFDEQLIDWLKVVHDHQIEIREYGYCSLVDLKRWNGIQGASPLFESLVVFDNHPVAQGTQGMDGAVRILASRVLESSAYPISLVAEPNDESITLRVHFDASRFSRETAATVLDNVKTILEWMAENPGKKVRDISLINGAARRLRRQCSTAELENLEAICELSSNHTEAILLKRSSGDSSSSLGQAVCTVSGAVDPIQFETAWQEVIHRHTALRASIVWSDVDEPLQVVHRRSSLVFTWQDRRSRSGEENEATWHALAEADRQGALESHYVPCLRVSVLRFETEYQVILTYDRLLLDNWSVRLLMRDVLSGHAASSNVRQSSQDKGQSYSDYVTWLQQQEYGGAEAFWSAERVHLKSPTQLRAALPASTDLHHSGTATSECVFSAAVSSQVCAFAENNELGLQAIFWGAWAVLLSRYSGQPEVLFGAALSRRPAELTGIENMVGNFMHTLPVRLPVCHDELLLPWLKDVQNRISDLLRYSCRPWPKLSQSRVEFASTPAFRFDHVLLLDDGPEMQHICSELTVTEPEFLASSSAAYPMMILVRMTKRISLTCIYATRDFESQAVTRLLGHFQQVLTDMTRDMQQSYVESSEGTCAVVTA